MKRFYIHTLGCPKNQVDSSSLSSLLNSCGLIETETFDEADFIIVNTCGFIEEAKEESIEHILEIIERKSPEQKTIVFGCLSERYKAELERELPEVDGIFGVDRFKEILDFIENYESPLFAGRYDNHKDTLHSFPCNDSLSTEVGIRKRLSYKEKAASYAYLKIAEGCNRRCTFCVIPSIRGSLRSYAPDMIIEEARRLIDEGVKEIILVAQDITSYGMDRGDYRLDQLIRELASMEGDFWIRLLYLYPTMIDDRLIDVIKEEEKVCKYIDMPIQHSQERILKLMGRGGSRKYFEALIERLRREIPGVVLRTTVIVGFPSEREEDFKGLLEFIKEVEFDRLGAFRYSHEEGTEAYRIKEQTPEEVKEERYHEIMKTQAEISYRKNCSLINKRLRILVDGISEDTVTARYYGQAPEIDGIVIIDDLKGDINPGEFRDAIVIKADEYDLRARIL